MKKKKYIDKSYNFVNSILSINFPLDIEIKYIRLMKKNPNVMGIFTVENRRSIIYLNPNLFQLSNKEIYKVIFHEIGHAIHFNYLDYIPQYLPRKHHGDTSYYCNSNQKESFAECFADYMWKLKKEKQHKILDSKRLSKMDRIITNLRSTV